MNNQKDVKRLVDRVIYAKDPKGADMNIERVEWPEGVGLYGLLRAYQTYGFSDCGAFLDGWIERHKREIYDERTINGTAPVMTILEKLGKHISPEDLGICTDRAEFLLRDAARLPNGALEHTVHDTVFKNQMWADTLVMACMLLAKLGVHTGDRRYTAEAQKQLVLHHKYLKDPDTGLFFHGYSEDTGDHLSAVRWGRANAWITLSTVEMLELLPPDFAGRQEVLESLQGQVAALASCQRADGMFGTVLDWEGSYNEASATAGIAYGICRGIKDGYIGRQYAGVAQRAQEAVRSRINAAGELEDVSWGTPILPSKEEYNAVAIRPMLYGQALAILMLCEMEG